MKWQFFLFIQIDQVELEMPNVHYFLADLKKIGMENNDEVVAKNSIGSIDGLQYASSTAIFNVLTKEKCMHVRAAPAIFPC